jgi:hypothetical protein
MLYADTIEVLSLGNQMIRNLNVLAAGQSTNLLPVLDSLGDKTLRHLSPGVDVQQLRQMIPILGGVDPEAVRSLAAADPEMQQLADFADVLDEGQATMNSAMAGSAGGHRADACRLRRRRTRVGCGAQVAQVQ